MCPDEHDGRGEPILDCDRCGGNVYEGETYWLDGGVYCDQCAWMICGGSTKRLMELADLDEGEGKP